jgi:signal transduction histidine kinase
MAEGVVAAIAPLAIRQGRTLAFEPRPGTVVSGDADAIAHALRNLLENALRFSPQTEEVVVVITPEGGLEVRDRGPGIPDDQKPLVTQRFWRASTSDLGGTGLGLSIVQRIAQAHGTTLTLADRDGGGTTFTIALKRAPSPPAR